MIFPTKQLQNFFKSRPPQTGIISVYGDTGVGKTTFAFQIASNMVLSGKKNIIIYTKNDFPIKRLYEVSNDDMNCLNNFLSNTLILNSSNFKQLRLISFELESLMAYLTQQLNFLPSLLVIDSITDLYKLELNMEKKEKNIILNYELNQVMANLLNLSENLGLEILLINDLSRKGNEEKIDEVQSGGQVMDYWVSYAIKIARTANLNERSIELTKSPDKRITRFTSKLTKMGFQ